MPLPSATIRRPVRTRCHRVPTLRPKGIGQGRDGVATAREQTDASPTRPYLETETGKEKGQQVVLS